MTQIIKLIKKEVVANDTIAFYWEKPTDFEFVAGQNADFTLIDPTDTDGLGNTRTLSFANAPFEQNLITATRMRDTAFKRNLKNMTVGAEVKLTGPYGDFKLHKSPDKPAIFLIGGIGITPVRSIIANATNEKIQTKITLLYSNRTPADAPFINDFENFEKNNPYFTFVPVYTNTSKLVKNGEYGHINEAILKKYISDFATPIYYLSGPPKMVRAMRQMLTKIGADDDNIRTEEFSGY
jgi:ferredoxin-NADP reductase